MNRLAMVDEAPKNSESWFLRRSIKLLQKGYPWLKFVNTWADGLRCQGGTIYKAAGFRFIRKAPIEGLYQLPNGEVMHQIAFDKVWLKRYYTMLKGVHGRVEKVRAVFGQGVQELTGGYQYHYVLPLDPALEHDWLLPPQPYEENMRVQHDGRAPGFHPGGGGPIPTHPLQEAAKGVSLNNTP